MNRKQGEKHLEKLGATVGYFKEEGITGSISLPPDFLDDEKSYFSATASGNGMSGVGINDGDIIVFETTDHVESGDVGMFFFDGKSACRIYRKYDSGKAFLLATDSSREPYEIKPDDNTFHVAGKLACIVKKAGKNRIPWCNWYELPTHMT